MSTKDKRRRKAVIAARSETVRLNEELNRGVVRDEVEVLVTPIQHNIHLRGDAGAMQEVSAFCTCGYWAYHPTKRYRFLGEAITLHELETGHMLINKVKEECTHPVDSWEMNPITNVHTRRCVRCGYILESVLKEKTDVQEA